MTNGFLGVRRGTPRRARLLAALGATVAAAVATSGLVTPLEASAAAPGAAAAPRTERWSGRSAAFDAEHRSAGDDPTTAVGPGLYVVALTARPAAAYTGGVEGLAATRPRPGDTFDRTEPRAGAYRRHLLEGQDRILDKVGNPPVRYRFTTALNGFAAELTTDQVKQLRDLHGVALVERSTTQRLAAHDGPGADDTTPGTQSAPDRTRGLSRARAARPASPVTREPARPAEGGGAVIGVIDSGLWPENPSFAALPNAPRHPRGFHGTCRTGEQWNAGDCNSKVVGARYFVKGFGAERLAQADYLSPRDGTGHGSMAASTAAGNRSVRVEIEHQDFGYTSGAAPAARIAVYKACWTAPNPADDGCSTADVVAAVDAAVADGVDVISYGAVGPSRQHPRVDAVGLSFLNATASGVFVTAPAGNAGPAPGSVAHPAPWVTTVGASTDRLYQGAVELGDAEHTRLVGAMVSDEDVPSTGLVLAADVAAPGADPGDAAICQIGALDASQVQDHIVVCDRGTTARVDKSVAVARAGGAGMVLANVTPNSLDADFHSVPTVHVDVAAAKTIKAYVRDAGDAATASLDASGADDIETPQVAEFSARGPAESDPAAAGDAVLKPDLVAPGVSVLAAVAPASDDGRLWDLASGTSLSAPRIAGLAATVRAVRPQWTPAQVRSAMMTTAQRPAGASGPFAAGAGEVDPTAVLDPGLVLDVEAQDYRDYLAGTGFTYADGTPVSRHPAPAPDLNLPSITLGALTGETTVIRKVTNLSGRTETYTPDVTGLSGLDVTVRPRQLTLSSGESARFRVTFDAGRAAPATYLKGAITWTGLEHQLRLPVAVQPALVDVPDEVSADLADGAVAVRGRAGTDGEVALTAEGLVSALPAGVALQPGGFDPDAPVADSDTYSAPIHVGEGTAVVRLLMDGHREDDDLDLFVYRDGGLVARSTSPRADETLTLVDPPPGDYTVYVHAASAANGSTAAGQFYSWLLSGDDAGNVTTSPATVPTRAGGRFSYEVQWADLGPYKWFGAIRYGDRTGAAAERTYLTIG
ncbi:MAG TPA: S8 family serine peptidase [Nocardioidaceae bacterium]|nr:S8 family serine peptidase [Nocardioidaceae bacterium]